MTNDLQWIAMTALDFADRAGIADEVIVVAGARRDVARMRVSRSNVRESFTIDASAIVMALQAGARPNDLEAQVADLVLATTNPYAVGM